MNNEQRNILKSLMKDILEKYNKQSITYEKGTNTVNVNGESILLPKSSERSIMSSRNTFTR
jgi:hypothetical protein